MTQRGLFVQALVIQFSLPSEVFIPLNSVKGIRLGPKNSSPG